ncbi:MAG: cardiolipin synthase [Lachnospiraceae bacterium]
MLILTLLVLQILFLIAAFLYLGKYSPYLFACTSILALILVFVLMNRPLNPEIQISWIVIILLFPILGTLFYLFVDMQIGYRLMNKRLQALIQQTKHYAPSNPDVIRQLQEKEPGMVNLAAYMMEHGNFPMYQNTSVQYFPSGEAKFEELLSQLSQAKHFIFLEYFIISEGYMWGRILKVLEQKVKEGVEVRVMYDGLCAVVLLPYQYPAAMQKLGIQCKMFAPVRVAVSTHYNNRDHRKIVVIDGQTAFTGGVNLSDEYINRRVLHGHWKDTAVMLQGEAVQSFTLMFLQMWNINEKTENYEKYLTISYPQLKDTRGYVMPYGDSPLDDENVGEMVYMDILNRAERYVHIMTPYLILDHEMITALTFAAKRGVDVVLILPHIPDKKFAFALAKNHYPELIRAGVHIYEYTPGFVHAKMFVSDDIKAVVGTINLDYRSLYLHFECATYLYDTPAVLTIEQDMQDTLSKSQQITLLDCKHVRLTTRLLGKFLKLIAPLM